MTRSGSTRGESPRTTRCVAFLRAINVGGHTVTMDRLRLLFEALGVSNVETFIASGNVLFDGPRGNARALERRIEWHLAESLGYDVATFIRTPDELAAVAACVPFDGDGIPEGGTLSIGFLHAAPSEEVARRIEALGTATDELRVHGRELYWRCGTRTSDSKITGALLERALGAPMTMRNVTTVRKLAAKVTRP